MPENLGSRLRNPALGIETCTISCIFALFAALHWNILGQVCPPGFLVSLHLPGCAAGLMRVVVAGCIMGCKLEWDTWSVSLSRLKIGLIASESSRLISREAAVYLHPAAALSMAPSVGSTRHPKSQPRPEFSILPLTKPKKQRDFFSDEIAPHQSQTIASTSEENSQEQDDGEDSQDCRGQGVKGHA